VSAGHPWPDIIKRQGDFPSLSYNDMLSSQQGNPWPDMNIMQVVKHNNEMASAYTKMLILQYNAQQILWRENVE
jgi:hypothetical protein